MLGAQVNRSIVQGKPRVDLTLGGANILIAESHGHNEPPAIPYRGLEHFGLRVNDLDSVAAELKAKGCEFTKDVTDIRPGVRICFIRGPQNISIEILERKPPAV